MASPADEVVPSYGQWPVDPQEDTPVSKDRIWVDGCFDFSHHGHAGAMLQARRLGKELFVGIHSDEAILENKGPTVMTLKERSFRVAAVEACRWATKAVPHAPYVTSLPWVSHYGCFYVVHGDDITSDSNGEDCYRFVKAAGRFLVVKRTPGISTTDLVGRMLLCTRGHFIKSFKGTLSGEEGSGSAEERKAVGDDLLQRIREYATDQTGLQPGPDVWTWTGPEAAKLNHTDGEPGVFDKLVAGKPPRPGQRVVYVDGGFDLFSSGHIEFLRQVVAIEDAEGQQRGWFEPQQREQRLKEHGEDYGPAYVIAGIHDDAVINHWKGLNYPIMNIFERGLCVLQCKYIHAVIFSAPFTPSKSYLQAMPTGVPSTVYHGPTTFIPLTYDPYTAPKHMGIFKEVPKHDFQDVNAGQIVQRILKSREAFEERQRAKLQKAVVEDAVKQKEAQA
ncbi:phosphoethanolamine [Paecilomyces variotii No. 5]|uniref:ethanolamine-phosphate cytidylyltransferase n=1 Tax=Byssochlamys spectabilis (strain No. 5 / NBRC 109023) TaxID=1356009 RepID=V5HZJ8_BYSSN|nr:phosphoethanolamine [Paecilomyces variotii No. 5]